MSETYVESRGDRLYVRESRVSLESLTLAEVYGAIAYYLNHQQEVDALLAAGEAHYQAQRSEAASHDPERYAALQRRFDEARVSKRGQ